jgi:Ca2+-binding RTX toxin-like protein
VTELAGGGNNDTVLSSLTYTLGANVEHLVLAGVAAINGTGNALNNDLTGNAANNTLDGLAGADLMTGGAGDDTYTVDNAGDDIVELAGEGTDQVNSSVTYTLSDDVENLTLTGAGNIDGTGNDLVNTINGTTGNNVLDGGLGADTMIGGTGNDTYVIDDAGDVATEGAAAGTDLVQAYIGYTLSANIENLTLLGGDNINGTGNTAVNTITGNDANNTLDGGTGADTMVGLLGDDTYIVDNAADVVTEAASAGTDTVRSTITFTIAALANIENITLDDAGGAINATGNAGINVLTGNSSANALNGGTGADVMAGLAGNDTYTVDDINDVVTELAGGGTDSVSSSVTYTLAANVENLTLTGATNINATGNSDINTLTGNTGNNTLDGGVGADTMIGLAGNDVYIVDDAGDTVTEAAAGGTDTIQANITYSIAALAQVENLTLTGSANIDATGNTAVNIITGNSGNNTLDGGTGIDTLVGGLGNDTYVLDVATDVVTENASEGTDTVMIGVTYTLGANLENLVLTGVTAINGTGNALNNTITGNSAVNALNGGAGADTMIGGNGNDTYTVDDAGDVIVEIASEGTDTVTSTVSYTLADNVDNLTLSGGNLDATGNNDVNVLTGTTGDNTLNGGVGADTMVGLAGNDTYYVDNVGDVVTEAAAAGTDTVVASISYSISALANLENITLDAAAGNINATGNTSVNILLGNTGDNSLDGGTGADTMTGGDGNDTYFVDNVGDVVTETNASLTQIDTVRSTLTFTLGANFENLVLLAGAVNGTGNALVNTIDGNASANIIDGGAGADLMRGSTGNDTYVVDDAGDVVSEIAGEGTDLVQSSVSFNLTGTEAENLTLTGGSAINGTGSVVVNTITGNTAANTLDGGAGADTLIGGTGNDVYIVDNVADVTTENVGEGTDTVRASVNWTLAANVENLVLTGVTNINGTGNTGVNIITGNDGNNTLDGAAGADTMSGGLGDDTYIVDATDTIVENAAEGTDTVSSALTFTLAANFENLTLTGAGNIDGTGNSVANILNGNTGNNVLDGGAGADTMAGGAGNDTYVVDEVGDVVTEGAGAGTDTVQSAVSYTLGANLENLTLTGSADIDGTGNGVANTIIGNAGSNVLDGSTGADTLTGGLSDDIFFMENSGDVVTDFNTGQGDALDIADLLIGYDPFLHALSDFVQINDSVGNSVVMIDADGLANGVNFVQVGTLQGVTGLTDEDLLVTNGNLIVQ